MFGNGELRQVVMLLSERLRDGYEIITALEERVGGGYSPGPGIVYPILPFLDEVGHAAITEQSASRKLYLLTVAGEVSLVASRSTAAAIFAKIDAAAADRGGPSPQVVRAAENLNRLVRRCLQLRERPPSPAQISAIAAPSTRRPTRSRMSDRRKLAPTLRVFRRSGGRASRRRGACA